MTDWMEGYASGDTYTKNYFRELNPNRLVFSLLSAGIMPPIIRSACELGFGFGLSVNSHASSMDMNWFGNDYNPTQKNFAQRANETSGDFASLSDESFKELCSRSDLGRFDYIGLHGVWSWISAENQDAILQFINTHLSPSGVVYMSYNVAPGSIAFDPVRQLMLRQFTHGTASNRKLGERIQQTLEYMGKVADLKPRYLEQSPGVKSRLNSLNKHNASYLSHEYLNRDWNIESFISISEKMAGIKLEHGVTANVLDTVDTLNLSEEQNEFLKSTPDVTTKEFLKDMIWSETFRRDYWVKGPRPLTEQDKWSYIGKLEVIQSDFIDDKTEDMEIKGRHLKGGIKNELYRFILSEIKEGQKVSIESLATKRQGEDSIASVIQAIKLLSGTSLIQFCSDNAFVKMRRTQDATSKLNDYYCSQSVNLASTLQMVFSPVTGESLNIGRTALLYLHVCKSGVSSFEEACKKIVVALSENGELIRDGDEPVVELDKAANLIKADLEEKLPKLATFLYKHGIELRYPL